MRKEGVFVFFLLSFFVILLIAFAGAITRTCYSCQNCTDEIKNSSSGDIIQLNQSISNVVGDCIDFSSKDNITFDCQNYSNFIDGDEVDIDFGLYFSAGAGGSVSDIVKNCNITGFYQGIYLYHYSNSNLTFANIIANQNIDCGINLNGGSNNTLVNITANFNKHGIYSSSNHTKLVNVIANSNSKMGVNITSNINNTLINITANLNGENGIDISYSVNNTLINITANLNQAHGIYLSFFNKSILSNIISFSNAQRGVFCYYCNWNNLTEINSTGNSQAGIEIDYSFNNIIKNTTSNLNYYGIYLQGSNFNIITNFSSDLSSDSGLFLGYANSNNITNMTLRNNSLSGIYIQNAANNTINNTNITVQGTQPGITVVPPEPSSINLVRNSVDNSVNINGKPVQFFDGYYKTCPNNQFLEYNNTYSHIFLLSCNNVTINATEISDSIYLFFTNNSKVYNANSSNSGYGFYLYYARNNTLSNVTADYNSNYGVYLSYSGNNTITNSTVSNNVGYGYGISLSYSSNNQFININANKNNYSAFTLYGSNSNILRNLTLNNNSYMGIDISSSNNNTLTNITANSNFPYGVYFSSSLNNIISNSTFQENAQLDIFIDSCNDNNLLQNITSSGGRVIEFYNSTAIIENKTFSELILCNANNSRIDNVTIKGSDSLKNNYLYLFSSSNVTISNVNSSDNYYGISLLSGLNNTLMNIIANSNNYSGIYFSDQFNNNLINATLNSNENYGVIISNSNNNIISNSSIQNNLLYGISLSGSNNNWIYNNLFNNTANYNNESGLGLTNYFNTTKTNGTSITNHLYIGGNFWGNPSGTGFSEICALDEDGDYICDYNYTLDSLNYDYLPLIFALSDCIENWQCTDWAVCSGDVQARACIDLNACGTFIYKPAESQPCESGGGGGSGGGSTTTTKTVTSISSSSPTEIIINQPGIDLLKLTLIVTEDIPSASITITKVEVTSEGSLQIGLPSGDAYQAFRINTTGLDSSNIKNVTIDFKVNKTWLENKNGTTGDVRLYRMPDEATQWTALTTNFVSEDAGYYYFSSFSPGFSTFAIFYGKYECQPGIKRCFNEQSQLCLGNSTWLVTEKCKFGCENGECIETAPQSIVVYTGIIVIVSLSIILTSYLVLSKIFKRKK
jgi:PGF-pre-PGF domain-containing protein